LKAFARLAFAQQVTTLPRIQHWKEMEGGKPATEIIKSNVVVTENETFEALLLAYKTNLLVVLGSLNRPIYTLFFAVTAWIAPACMPYSAYGTMPVCIVSIYHSATLLATNSPHCNAAIVSTFITSTN
jgi:hypothetical protein